MKIAICLYGLHPDETWNSSDGCIQILKKKDRCLEFWKKNVFSVNDCDIFMHSFSKKHKELLEYNPTKYLFENIDNFDNHKVDKEKKTYYLKKYNYKTEIPINIYISYGIKKVVEIMNNYSIINSINYDLVLVSRIDIIWLRPLIFNNLNINKFYSPVWGKDNFFSKDSNFKKILSYWFISNKTNIIKFSKLYDNIYHYLENDHCWHIIPKKYIDTFIDKIEYKFNSSQITHTISPDKRLCKKLYNTPVDMDLQRYLYLHYNSLLNIININKKYSKLG